ncbi:MAG TPA: FlgD immunoglobulin-like domain containing protein, partial [Candidatus Eisenbacteria bacterium]
FTVSFPAETQAAGYQAQSFNGPLEGVRCRRTIVRSPLFLGLAPRTDPVNGSPFVDMKDVVQAGQAAMVFYFDRRTIEARLVALGLVNQQVPIDGTAYSNRSGRGFAGLTYLGIAANNLAGSAVRLEQNSPNPFNPVTKIRFATSKAGNVALRVYNVSGQLVKTLADRNFEAGAHEITWDGKNSAGLQTSSGVYYAKVSASGGANDVIKMVMAK